MGVGYCKQGYNSEGRIVWIKRHKYMARRTTCGQGHSHPSKLEANYCDTLYMLKASGDVIKIEHEPVYELVINGILICRHKPDFKVWYKDGTVSVQECKGWATREWRMKKKLFSALFPDVHYEVIK